MRTITKKSVLSALPARKTTLLAHCPTERHVTRLEAVLKTLKDKSQVTEIQIVTHKDKETGVEFTTPFYRLATAKDNAEVMAVA